LFVKIAGILHCYPKQESHADERLLAALVTKIWI
jgi:hypothetical protein